MVNETIDHENDGTCNALGAMQISEKLKCWRVFSKDIIKRVVKWHLEHLKPFTHSSASSEKMRSNELSRARNFRLICIECDGNFCVMVKNKLTHSLH